MNRLSKFVQRLAALCEEPPTASEHAKAKPTQLRTYISSLMSLLLCMAMFLGTTYAWFSSNVTNRGNEIYIGTLDVGLYKQDGDTLLNLADSNHKLFDNTTLWEPGYTTSETIHIVNKSTLPFKYRLSFTDGVLADNQALLLADVAKCFDVWVFFHMDGNAPTATDYTDVIAPDSGWVNAGTLDVLLNGKPVLEGAMGAMQAGTPSANTVTYTIVLHMLEDSSPAVMGQKISLNVKLVAYQMSADDSVFTPVTDEDLPAEEPEDEGSDAPAEEPEDEGSDLPAEEPEDEGSDAPAEEPENEGGESL